MTQSPSLIPLLDRAQILQPSKWLTFRILIDKEEMEDLLESCSPLFLCNVAEMVDVGEELLAKEAFLSCYDTYLSTLQKGLLPSRKQLRPFFSSAWTASLSAIGALPVGTNRQMIKPMLPVIQLSSHFFSFSKVRSAFLSMVHSQEGIPWGIQFAYPQLYAQSGTFGTKMTLQDNTLPNFSLFRSFKEWVKEHTRPAKFLFRKEKKVTATFRITSQAAKWMASFPLLKGNDLELLT